MSYVRAIRNDADMSGLWWCLGVVTMMNEGKVDDCQSMGMI